MLQIELYIKEITRFLSTVTLKNVYFRNQMEDVWVNDYFKGRLPEEYQPYYRHLNGDYILKDLSTFRKTTGITAAQMSDAAVCDTYGLSLSTTIGGKHYSNREIYTQFDELVMVNSVDTKQPVPFTKRMLASKAHQKTASLYRIPSRYYSNLRTKYAQSSDIIKAIVYPIPSIRRAIEADNYDVISCDLTQLRENEQASMYACMLKILDVIKRRWDVKDFVYEDLYALSMQGHIWSILLLALFAQRVANIRTAAAHEYHIWEFLSSHGIADCRSILSLNQSVFLYRNFLYLLRNRGTNFNLILLAHKLLSEWDIQIQGKNLLQQTETVTAGQCIPMINHTTIDPITKKVSDTPQALATIDSIVVGDSILKTLRHIDTNETSGNRQLMYLNKTMKAADELDSFNDQNNELQKMSTGQIESLDTIFQKEKDSQLEYQDNILFKNSTIRQCKQFTYMPHTCLPTKLLEITKPGSSTLFKQLYAKFITESLIYQLSLNHGDYYISFMPAGQVYAINLTVKEAIAFSIYCWLKETGWYKANQHLSKVFCLSLPFKSTFPSIPKHTSWNNIHDISQTDLLTIKPTKFILTSHTLPVEVQGEYRVMDPSESLSNLIWFNANNASIRFITTGAAAHWELDSRYGVFYFNSDMIYQNQLHYTPIWEYAHHKYDSTIVISEYNYVIDDYMPLRFTQTYAELIKLLNEQALGYLSIYQELHHSDYSRQRAALKDIVLSRMFHGIVHLDLLDGRTFDEMIAQNADLQELIHRVEANPPDVIKTEYSKLGSAITGAIIPIESEYLEDNTGIATNRYTLLKKLFVSLCSYNIAYVEGSQISDTTSTTLTSFITQDVVAEEFGIDLHDYIPPTSMHMEYNFGIKTPLDLVNVTSIITPTAPATRLQIGYHEYSREEIQDIIVNLANSLQFTDAVAKTPDGKWSSITIKFVQLIEHKFKLTINTSRLPESNIVNTLINTVMQYIKQNYLCIHQTTKYEIEANNLWLGDNAFDDVTRVNDLNVCIKK